MIAYPTLIMLALIQPPPPTPPAPPVASKPNELALSLAAPAAPPMGGIANPPIATITPSEVRMAELEVQMAQAKLNMMRLKLAQSVALAKLKVESAQAALKVAEQNLAQNPNLQQNTQALLAARIQLAECEVMLTTLTAQNTDTQLSASEPASKPTVAGNADMPKPAPATPVDVVSDEMAKKLLEIARKKYTSDGKNIQIESLVNQLYPDIVVRFTSNGIGNDPQIKLPARTMTVLEWSVYLEDYYAESMGASDSVGMYVRDYGLILMPKNQAPPGAVLFRDFIKFHLENR